MRLRFALDLANGLAYLHARRFIHRDVATRNVLLSSSLAAKLSDFGLTRESIGNNEYYRSHGGAMPVRWTSPEALEQRKFSAASDVYAYGITLYELWTDGAMPYEGWTNQRVWVNVQAGYKLPCPDKCDPRVHEQLMVPCWAFEASQRPTMERLVPLIKAMADAAAAIAKSGGGAGAGLAGKAGPKAEQPVYASDGDYAAPSHEDGKAADSKARTSTAGYTPMGSPASSVASSAPSSPSKDKAPPLAKGLDLVGMGRKISAASLTLPAGSGRNPVYDEVLDGGDDVLLDGGGQVSYDRGRGSVGSVEPSAYEDPDLTERRRGSTVDGLARRSKGSKDGLFMISEQAINPYDVNAEPELVPPVSVAETSFSGGRAAGKSQDAQDAYIDVTAEAMDTMQLGNSKQCSALESALALADGRRKSSVVPLTRSGDDEDEFGFDAGGSPRVVKEGGYNVLGPRQIEYDRNA
jgi:hypothetical protein